MDDLGVYEEPMSGIGQMKLSPAKRMAGVDFVDFMFWDTQNHPTGGQTQLVYFTTPYGGSKSKLKTNMAAAGYITNALEFHLKAIGVGNVTATESATATADLQLVTMSAYLELIIQDKVWFQAVLCKVPFGGGLYADGGLATAGKYVPQIGSPNRTAGYKLRHTIVIPKNVNFYVTLNWPTAVTPTAALDLIVTLEGSLARTGNK